MDLVLSKGDFIAKGEFGSVYTSKNKLNTVIKIIKKTKNDLEEIKMLKKAQSDFVIRLWNWEETPEELILELEAMWGGDLYKYVYEKKTFPFDITDIYRQIILAIKYINNKCIMHRDIKLENILLSREGKVKLGDFAFAVCFNLDISHPNEKIINGKFYKIIGTLPYLSPEMINKTGYHKQTDIWSSGVLLYEMLGGYLPFASDNESETLDMICYYNYPPLKTSNKFRTLLSGVLKKNPKERWTVDEILSHL
jgi:serine/threonine protein kinase